MCVVLHVRCLVLLLFRFIKIGIFRQTSVKNFHTQTFSKSHLGGGTLFRRDGRTDEDNSRLSRLLFECA